ncbi:MAG: glycosyltransferase [Solirubrobacteraceae bacterium]|nr:glycosyltransferase [Solirubrobacteraceae bacterium]
MRLHQVLSGAGPYDAITREALAIRDLAGSWGHDGADYAVHIDPRMGRRMRPFAELAAAPGDTLLIHYSAYAPKLGSVLEHPGRKILLSHNVTPARWFWEHDAQLALQCALGRRELPQFAARCDDVVGDSLFNAREIGFDRALPLVLPGIDAAAPLPPEPEGPPTVLFVGRLVPHKRQDELIRAIALLRRHRDPQARLVLVGEPLHERYYEALVALAESVAPGGVVFERSLDDAALAARYRSAHAFLCLSEHEGFCVPLLEAFQHGVPVVARPRGAVTETVGDAALLHDGALDEMVELVHFAITDPELRRTLRARGHARLAAYSFDRTSAALRELLEGAGAT